MCSKQCQVEWAVQDPVLSGFQYFQCYRLYSWAVCASVGEIFDKRKYFFNGVPSVSVCTLLPFVLPLGMEENVSQSFFFLYIKYFYTFMRMFPALFSKFNSTRTLISERRQKILLCIKVGKIKYGFLFTKCLSAILRRPPSIFSC